VRNVNLDVMKGKLGKIMNALAPKLKLLLRMNNVKHNFISQMILKVASKLIARWITII
jgi:hypothetical protein